MSSHPYSFKLSRLDIFGLLDLQAEIDMLDRLMDNAGTEDVDLCEWSTTCLPRYKHQLTVNSSFMEVSLSNISAALKQEFAFSAPFVSQSSCNGSELISFNVIEHDNVRAGVDGFVRFSF